MKTRKIKNPYISLNGYNCFGCSPDNPYGLKMQFTEIGDEVVSEWLPTINHQGFYNILHGGVQATLIDEIAAWAVMVKLRTSGVTTNMDVEYLKPVFTNKGKVVLKAYIQERERRNAIIKVGLYNSEGELCSSATVGYFIFPEGVAGKRLFYPGFEAFFEPGDNGDD